MTLEQRLRLARQILLFKILVTFFAWAIPLLLGPLPLLARLDMPVPENPIYLRVVGAVALASGIAHLLAYLAFPHNRGLLIFATAENLLVGTTVVMVGLRHPIGWFDWLAGALTLFFGLSFLLLFPWGARTTKDRRPL